MKKDRSNYKLIPILCIDFETSGFIHEGAQPLEFAALLVDPRTHQPMAVEDNTFQCLFQLDSHYKMAPKAKELFNKSHDFTVDELVDYGARSFFENLQNFAAWLELHGFDLNKRMQITLLGQNLPFDVAFLRLWLGEKFCEIFHYHTIDTQQIAQFLNTSICHAVGFEHMPFVDRVSSFPSVSLDAQCAAYDYKNEGAHSAMGDVFATTEMLRNHILHFSEDIRNSLEYRRLKENGN